MILFWRSSGGSDMQRLIVRVGGISEIVRDEGGKIAETYNLWGFYT
jgi:hypothetical protein